MGIRPVSNKKMLSLARGEWLALSMKVTTFLTQKKERDGDTSAERIFFFKAGCKQNILHYPKATGLFIIIRADLVANR